MYVVFANTNDGRIHNTWPPCAKQIRRQGRRPKDSAENPVKCVRVKPLSKQYKLAA